MPFGIDPNFRFSVSQSPWSIRNVTSVEVPGTLPTLKQTHYYVSRGLQGLGDDTTDGSSTLSTIFGGFSLQTLLLLGGLGLLAYWLFASNPAKERRSALRSETERHKVAVKQIKRKYSRFGRRGEGGTEGKKWVSGAYRSADYEE